jgi:hypothetical protein
MLFSTNQHFLLIIMSSRIGAGARARRAEAHRRYVSNINYTKMQLIREHVMSSCDIMLISQYQRLMCMADFEGIDRLIASFSNESFKVTIDIDAEHCDEHTIGVKDTDVDVLVKNDGSHSVFVEPDEVIAEDNPSAVQVPVSDIESPMCKDSVDSVGESECEVSVCANTKVSPASSVCEDAIVPPADSPVVNAPVPTVESNSIMFFHPSAEQLDDCFFRSSVPVGVHNATHFVRSKTFSSKDSILLTDRPDVFEAANCAKVAIVPPNYGTSQLGKCFLMRTEKDLSTVFSFRRDGQSRRFRLTPPYVDLTLMLRSLRSDSISRKDRNWKKVRKRASALSA